MTGARLEEIRRVAKDSDTRVEATALQDLLDAHTLLIATIRDFQTCTRVLGSGVGKIFVPDGFFQKWNDTEAVAQQILARLEKE